MTKGVGVKNPVEKTEVEKLENAIEGIKEILNDEEIKQSNSETNDFVEIEDYSTILPPIRPQGTTQKPIIQRGKH